ncbi:MAG: flavodoxin family protein [Verrucomicrobia bacterium]|nr:flavodoxin family protein [Verrucomicrobiota bacterium]
MSTVLFNGSPRKGGNTELCLKRVEKKLQAHGIRTELIPLAEKEIHPCKVCLGCKGKRRCAQDDDLNELLAKMEQADGIIIGSPTWFGSVSGWVKNLIDRAGFVSRMNGHMFYRKVGAPVVAVRRGGAVQTYNTIISFFAIDHFYIVGSSYWNFAFGLRPGEAAEDAEGMETMDDLADNMAHLLKVLKAAE